MPATVPLADFDPPVARAVVAVLRRAGVPAAVADDALATGAEVTVVVPPERRDEALAAMAAGMEEIQAELAQEPAAAPPGAAAQAPHADDDDDEPAPLLFERMRRLGFLPVLLVPLLVVTLSQTRLPAVYAVALIIGGALAVVAWRDGRRLREED